MPHIIIEHNHPEGINLTRLLDNMHEEATKIDAFPIGGIRVREHAVTNSRVGDGAAQNGFIYVYVRIGQGRSDEVKRDIGERLFEVVTSHTSGAFEADQPLSLGLELQEVNTPLTWKQNNLHKLSKK